MSGCRVFIFKYMLHEFSSSFKRFLCFGEFRCKKLPAMKHVCPNVKSDGHSLFFSFCSEFERFGIEQIICSCLNEERRKAVEVSI